jgi:gluconokinase
MNGRSPLLIVVMGVSGSGKSTLGAMLAAALGCPFLEGDAFHAPASVAKMRAGQPLQDIDRWPWLARLGDAAGDVARKSGAAVIACSALKRGYRERLAGAAGLPMRFVLLDAGVEELARRLSERQHHYMPVSLLGSQLAILERPERDELAITLDSTRPPHDLSDEILAWTMAEATL